MRGEWEKLLVTGNRLKQLSFLACAGADINKLFQCMYLPYVLLHTHSTKKDTYFIDMLQG